MKRNVLVLILALACIAALCCGCEWKAVDAAGDRGPGSNGASGSGAVAEYAAFADYAAILARLQSASSGRDDAVSVSGMGVDTAAEAPAAPTEEAAADTGSAATDYSQTNVQVAGVDEGDIVKTDGSYIYILRDNGVIILRAAGGDTEEVSRFTVADNSKNYSGYASELYVYGDTLAVVLSSYGWIEPYAVDGGASVSGEAVADIAIAPADNTTQVALYDISDRTSPRRAESFGQDGYYVSSRLKDGVVYLVSSYYVYTYDGVGTDDPGTFVPCLYDGAAREVMAAGDIISCPGPGNSYTVVGAVDLARAERVGQQAALGAGHIVYMNDDNLYIAQSVYGETVTDSYTESVYTVRKITSGNNTELLHYDVSDGGLEFVGGVQVPGGMINQFAMDEYDGYLRVVTTDDPYSYTTYTDEERGFVNYVWEDDQAPTNALYVLDGEMNLVGSVTGLAAGEVVYAVRFDGETGYIVTYERIDPLFAVDLSDPSAPQVLSALKIPGFSQYLHVFGEGLLLGLGMDTDEASGWAENMKLSMFDVGDKTDVREKATLSLDYSWSTALYNHKAIIVAADKDLIGFPTDSGYAIYGYGAERGFYQRVAIDLSGGDLWWYGDGRGLYIGDYFYIYTYSGLYVLDLASLSEIDYLSF